MFLFFDTETTGLPLDWRAPLENLDNWPRLVQLAWLLTDKNGKEVKSISKIIKPEGFIIPAEAAAVHGISTERAQVEGVLLPAALKEFSEAVDEAKILVAHNMSFDEKIMGAELLREKQEHKLFERPKICTMQSSTQYCKIENDYGYKWPKLIELHQKLFSEEFDNAHDALADVKACARCFFELMKRRVI